MIFDDVVAFLKKVPPFQFLDDETLLTVVRNLSMEFYPKGMLILKQDDPPSDSLRIIKKGGVKVSMVSEGGEEVVIDFRGEGDTFGFLSLVGKDRVRSNVTAVDDTICYLLGKEMLLKLLDSQLSFTEYFLKSHITRYIDRTYREMQDRSMFYGGSDRLLFNTSVGDMGVKDVVSTLEDTTIRGAAQLMSEKRISSVVIMNRNGLPAGIVTDRDLRDKVVARGRSVEEPVRNIMSTSLIRVDAQDYCFEAVLRMIRYNVHHILVIKDGRLTGVITNHDLMMLQGSSPLSFAKDLESQKTIDGLITVSKKINRIITLLLKEGAKAGNITRIMTEINDRLIRKILEIAESKFGRPPLKFCWIVFGSEGRKEQTFKTDQDNALIYDDPKTDEEEAAAEAYFAKYAAFVNEALIQCGFPPCSGGYMANNATWRQPLRRWKEYFENWIFTPTSEAILRSAILFDFRPVYGDLVLGESLRAHLHETLKGHELFLKHMANMTVNLRPPLGFFKTFVVEKSGSHKDELNLKFRVIAPLVDIVRLFSLESGVTETGTLERLSVLRERHAVVAEHGDELEHAFEFVSLLRVHRQFSQIEAGLQPDNFINPNKLTNLEKKTLKEIFNLILRVQDAIAKQYSPGTVM